jgi:TolB-like protein/DNA-binding winged helix-turn-helix (wHTH) protein/tetratricopeptide (TPR) repeat protein
MDLVAGEIRKAGMRLKLPGQPFQVLQALLERPQEIVTREELRQRLWPDNTFVDYDLALKKAVNRLREVLGDSAESPHFIETIPRRGYRFIGNVEMSASAPSTSSAQPLVSSVEAVEERSAKTRKSWKVIGALGLAGIAAVLLGLNAGKLRTRIFARSPSVEIHAIAVLPLENLSKDPEQEYFVDGMTDQLITELARAGELRVISHTSVTPYKGARKPLGVIAKELNVDAIVEGTVLRSGNRVRVTAQLVSASPERHLWADSYQGDLTDIFSLQDRVARSIAREIRVSLTPEEQARLTNTPPFEPEAYDAYVRGRYYSSQITADGFEKAVVSFRRAIELQPRYAQAYADLAETYCWAAATDVIPGQEGLPKARQAAMKALEIDERLSQAHSSLAWVKYVYEWNFPEAETEFHRSLELHPSTSWPPLWYGMYLAQGNRIEESIAEMRKVQQMDPLSPVANALALVPLVTGRKYDAAIEDAQKLLDMDRQNGLARWIMNMAYERKGDFSKAIALQEETAVLYGAPKEAAAQSAERLRSAYKTLGPPGYWRVNLERQRLEWKKKPGEPYDLAALYARAGDREHAFVWLDKAFRAHSQALIYWLRTDPAFDSFRSDAKYEELVRRIGFPR